jgi:heme A synthase
MYLTAGSVLGLLIVLFYLLAVLNYGVKRFHKKYGASLKSSEQRYGRFKAFMRFIVKNHRLFGALSLLMLLIHIVLQYRDYQYISPTGAAAGAVLAAQAFLGGYGSRLKSPSNTWLMLHRSTAVLIPFLMAVHIFT